MRTVPAGVGDGLGVPLGEPVGEGLGVALGDPVGDGLGVGVDPASIEIEAVGPKGNKKEDDPEDDDDGFVALDFGESDVGSPSNAR